MQLPFKASHLLFSSDSAFFGHTQPEFQLQNTILQGLKEAPSGQDNVAKIHNQCRMALKQHAAFDVMHVKSTSETLVEKSCCWQPYTLYVTGKGDAMLYVHHTSACLESLCAQGTCLQQHPAV